MAALSGQLRGTLEKAVLAGRAVSETAAAAALNTLGLTTSQPYATLTPEQRRLRVALRTRARQLGEGSVEDGRHLLVEEIAYEQWHRMLFARFLAENGLLMHPSGVAVTLEECAELAPDEGEPDAWSLAARYASAMLPGIFRVEDPSSQVRFAPEGRIALENIVAGLPYAVFTADDSLGWVYQFWQSKAKDEVNKSGEKIGAEELPAVTQLFTEDYMVRFLLENSLGAWWAGKHPESPLLSDFEYLRYKDDGTPAVGTFPGWPQRAAEVTVMDPCCGSGHFLVAAFEVLRRMRMEEEGLSEVEAGDAVLGDNLFGLEIDARCTQIAAFALAFAAWRAGKYRQLPRLNVACSGIPVKGQLEEWTRLAGEDTNLQMTLERLYILFREAPTLGSLINPGILSAELFMPDYSAIEELVKTAFPTEVRLHDPDSEVVGAAASEAAQAARLLTGTYTLIATNVPYLGYKKQTDSLKEFCNNQHPDSRIDLATVFLERCCSFTKRGGSYTLVTPQNWLFLGSYRRLREKMLVEQQWLHLSWLGTGAFGGISGEIVKPVLLLLSNAAVQNNHMMTGMDVSDESGPEGKALRLRQSSLLMIGQLDQLRNPDARVSLELMSNTKLLSGYATSATGMQTFDISRFVFKFWELQRVAPEWLLSQSTVNRVEMYGGRSNMVRWEGGQGQLYQLVLDMKANGYSSGIWKAGQQVWGQRGVLISLMGSLASSLYTGQPFDQNTSAVIPRDSSLLPALWAFCSSPEFVTSVRRIDQSIKVTHATVVKIPFDLEHWQKAAEEAGPLPEPYSNDPTQWLFKGDPADSTGPLQVAVARLLGYRWPDQQCDQSDVYTDDDGIVCLPSVAGEQSAGERLRALLSSAYQDAWSPAKQDQLLTQVAYASLRCKTPLLERSAR